jgi:hypothetical protein
MRTGQAILIVSALFCVVYGIMLFAWAWCS